LYRAIDSASATIDFLLSPLRSADAAKALFAKALADPSHPQPRVTTPTKPGVIQQRFMNPRKKGSYESAAVIDRFGI
jgi:transposase-like protein